MTITDTELDTRVSRGAALLDERYPGWAADVDRDALDISDTQFCAAAQIVCNSRDDDAYQGAMDELFGDTGGDVTVSHGFTLCCLEAEERRRELDLTSSDRTLVYAPLTDAWQRAIDARLNKETT